MWFDVSKIVVSVIRHMHPTYWIEMLHAQNFSYIQIWYTHPFEYRVYVYVTNFEREAYNKRTTQYDKTQKGSGLGYQYFGYLGFGFECGFRNFENF